MTNNMVEKKESCWKKIFTPKSDADFWPRAFRGTLAGVSVGAIFGSIRSVWTNAPYSKFAADRTFCASCKTLMRPMGYMAAAGFIYEGLSSLLFQARGRNDWKDAAAVGVVLGALAGFSRRSLLDAGKYALLLGVLNGSIDALDHEGSFKPVTPHAINKKDIYREKS
ncbi:hypothetical protein WA158_002919 [Blastocystis sp. Blastoise]